MLKLLSLVVIIYLTKSAHSVVSEWQQCGGDGYRGETVCAAGLLCCKQHQYYSQCLRTCPSGWTSPDVGTPVKEDQALPIYSQCGGQGYNGPTACAAGLQCYQQTIYYSQCLTSCPSDWLCSGSSTQAPTSGSTTNSNTQASTTISTGTLAPFNGNKWPTCKFRFGGSFVPDPSYDYSAWDYITIWIGSPSSDFGTNFNKWWHGAMLEATIKYKKTPVYYGYIIAFMARDMWGLQDCDVGTPSLCQRGSEFIRKNRAEIVAKYKHYAQETAKYVGVNAETIWLIEPDFWQYYGDTHQEGGALSGAYMRSLFDDFAAAIKSELPNARIAWDISAWLSESAMSTWWGYFKSSNDIDFLFTSGGQSRANSANIKPNELRWVFMSTLTGKRIIGDTGYGVAGGSTGHNYDWDDLNNLRARITDGVISVTQANPKKDWGTTLATLRQQLAPLC